ncbi:Rok-like winged helix domain-containing protein [Streptomyces inhibens]|uniref:Rok-like winged helix domain-containing protein n=1 Tax=Streptomyces inhibens TaxID=2293571 RepID=UPI00402AAE4F
MTDSLLHQTIESLESTLPELEEQERRLRGQLEDVVQRVTSARHALEHLRVLIGATAAADSQSSPLAAVTTDPSPAEPAPLEAAGDSAGQDSPRPDISAAPETIVEPERAASAVPQPRAAASSRAKASPAKKRTGKKVAAKKTAAPAKPKAKAKKVASKQAATAQPAAKGAASLIDAALDVLKNSSVPMRAREINAALGREATPGQIESVRNTLDRVAKQQKLVTRPGRGTYAAV